MQVLLGQCEPVPGDAPANARAIAEALSKHPGADLAVFPELFLSGYDLEAIADRAVSPDDPVLAGIGEQARAASAAIVVGFAEDLTDGRIANAVACFDTDGSRQATYRKTHLFGAEAGVFTAGDELVTTQLAGRRVAPMICFDMEFPEPARALARAGADLLVTVAANMEPYEADHHLAARARALDNRLPHVYVNRTGAEGGFRFVGGSLVAALDGAEVCKLGPRPQTSLVRVDLDRDPAPQVDYLRLARPELPVQAQITTTQGATP